LLLLKFDFVSFKETGTIYVQNVMFLQFFLHDVTM